MEINRNLFFFKAKLKPFYKQQQQKLSLNSIRCRCLYEIKFKSVKQAFVVCLLYAMPLIISSKIIIARQMQVHHIFPFPL